MCTRQCCFVYAKQLTCVCVGCTPIQIDIVNIRFPRTHPSCISEIDMKRWNASDTSMHKHIMEIIVCEFVNPPKPKACSVYMRVTVHNTTVPQYCTILLHNHPDWVRPTGFGAGQATITTFEIAQTYIYIYISSSQKNKAS